MKVFTAPENFNDVIGQPLLFLAGSIEMGKAVDWQKEATELALPTFNVLNPRRSNWDPSWEQTMDNPKFFEQVSWELSALEAASLVLFYFDPGTKSPISLLELGLFYYKGVVVCPEGFWRKGNVDIVCSRYDTVQVKTIEAGIKECQKQFASIMETVRTDSQQLG